MKKLICLSLAFALVVVLSQCKKKVETISSVPASVYITLDVDGGDKAIVDPHGGSNYATVTFEAGDVIYVGNDGKYCGYLEYDGTRFSGNITPTSGDDTDFLHFYFMGNKGPVGSAPSSVDISDQTVKYPVISYGRSTQLYNSDLTNYSATLYNKCAIMRFPIAGAGTNETVTITGMNNIVTVDFSKNNGLGTPVNPYTYSMSGNGVMTLHSESANEKWAIVLPQSAVNAQLQASGYYTETVSVPAISTNEYHNNDIREITLTPITSHFTEALFSVSDTTQVYFSPGNLQWSATGGGSTPTTHAVAGGGTAAGTWRFAEYQWDYVGTQTPDQTGNVGGTVIGSDNANISETYDGWIDLFGWGTSGYNGKNPWMTSTTTTDYGNGAMDIAGTNYDWGVNNTISNGGGKNWRTLTRDEWVYVFDTRSTSSDIRYAKAQVNSVNGVILLPDNWSASTYTLSSTNTARVDYTTNDISLNDWLTLESAGAVFLPAAGWRSGAADVSVGYVGSGGYYWSASCDGSSTGAYLVTFGVVDLFSGWVGRQAGRSVRLVRSAEAKGLPQVK